MFTMSNDEEYEVTGFFRYVRIDYGFFRPEGLLVSLCCNISSYSLKTGGYSMIVL